MGTVIAKPRVDDGTLGLEVQSVTGLGFTLPSESVQPALDAFTSHLTKDYPLGIKADSVGGHRYRRDEPVLHAERDHAARQRGPLFRGAVTG